MAGRKKEGLDYFPHDTNACSQRALETLIFQFGAAGYAFYFVHLEYIYADEKFAVDISSEDCGADLRRLICHKLQIDEEVYQKMLDKSLRLGLFDARIFEEYGCLTSERVMERADEIAQKRRTALQSYHKSQKGTAASAKRVKADSNAQQADGEEQVIFAECVDEQTDCAGDDDNGACASTTDSGSQAKAKQKQRVKVVKVAHKGAAEAHGFAKPTVEEIACYCRERGNQVDPQRFYDFYESKGWLVGKSPMIDWRASIRNWEREPTKPPTRHRDPGDAILETLQRYRDAESANC